MSGSRTNGIVFVIIGVIGYAFLPMWAKFIQTTNLAPLDAAAWRFLFAMPLMWLVVFVRREPVPGRPIPRRGLLGLGVLLAAAAVCMFFGLERLAASTYVLLFYTYPAMVALINLVLGERMPLQSWVALGLTLTGVALTVPDFGAGFTSDAGAGVLIAFANALSVAVYFILNNRLMRGHNAMLRASAWAITGAFLTILAVMLLRSGVTFPADVRAWAFLLGMALFSTVLPITMFMIGIQRLGASRAAILSTVEPIGTLILATTLLGETVQAVQLLGGAFIIASVILLQVRLRRPVVASASAGGAG